MVQIYYKLNYRKNYKVKFTNLGLINLKFKQDGTILQKQMKILILTGKVSSHFNNEQFIYLT